MSDLARPPAVGGGGIEGGDTGTGPWWGRDGGLDGWRLWGWTGVRARNTAWEDE